VENPSDKVPHGIQIWIKELTNRSPYYTSGLVGLMSYGDVAIPLPLIFTWIAAVGLLLVVAVRRCGRRIRLQLVILVVIPYAVLIFADGAAVRQGYWLSQGRYALLMYFLFQAAASIGGVPESSDLELVDARAVVSQ
jgi:hypothetical protein